MATRAQSKAATRERLITAGLALVRRRGFNISMDELARAAGMTKGAIYSNFADRSEVIAAIGERLDHGLQLDLDTSQPDLQSAIVELGRRAARAIDADREQFILTFDFFLQMLRDRQLRDRILPITDTVLERESYRDGEWLLGFDSPIDGASFNTVLNAVNVGMGLYRVLYGAEYVPDELFDWVNARISAPEPSP